jgi:HD-GYP domain-containing protein (c-di-GMP phosphodiesterase class II)
LDEKREKIRFVTPDWVKSPPPAMEEGQLGNHFILGLHSLMRSARVHGVDSETLDQSISQYLHIINPFILSGGGITLEIGDEGFLVNNRKIRGKPGDHAVIKSFMRNLMERRIGKLEIHNPLDERELKKFISLLLGLKEGDENNSTYLMEQLRARKIDSISSNKLKVKEQAFPEATEERRHPRELYFAAIGIVREIIEGVMQGKALNMRKARRLTQQMVATLMEDASILLGLAMIKDYGQYLYNHSVNVAIYSIALGSRLGFPKTNLVQLGIASLFHDIGKIRISKSVLNKSGQLTAKDWNIILRHPVYGVETITNSTGWSETTARMIETAFEHHMKEDRTGYPKLAAKKDLTLFGKIVAIGDFYDNLVRPPSGQLFPVFSDRATALFLDRGGSDFDPTLVKLFMQLIGLYPIGTLVMLESGEMGIVVIPNDDVELIDRPTVLLVRFQDGEYKGSGVLDLAEVDEETGKYVNTISKSLDPNEYQLNVAELLFYG